MMNGYQGYVAQLLAETSGTAYPAAAVFDSSSAAAISADTLPTSSTAQQKNQQVQPRYPNNDNASNIVSPAVVTPTEFDSVVVPAASASTAAPVSMPDAARGIQMMPTPTLQVPQDNRSATGAGRTPEMPPLPGMQSYTFATQPSSAAGTTYQPPSLSSVSTSSAFAPAAASSSLFQQQPRPSMFSPERTSAASALLGLYASTETISPYKQEELLVETPREYSLEAMYPQYFTGKQQQQQHDTVISITTTTTVAGSKRARPTRLATEDDADEVNQTHQLVRAKCLEIIVEGEDSDDEDEDDKDDDGVLKIAAKEAGEYESDSDDSYAPSPPTTNKRKSKRARTSSKKARGGTKAKGSSSSHRVGLCCVFCKDAEEDIAPMQSFFPKSIEHIYVKTCAWQRVHLKNCTHCPQAILDEYNRTKAEDKTRGRVPYWRKSAREIGLRDILDENGATRGIQFAH